MKKTTANLIYLNLLLCVFSIFIFCNTAVADEVITAELKAFPMAALPGSEIKFQAVVRSDPDFYAKPGDMLQIVVTKNDFSWISDKITIKYPDSSGILTINFTKPFLIPHNATPNQTLDFTLTNNFWIPLSKKISVKVLSIQKIEKGLFKKIDKISPVRKKNEN